MPLILFSGGCDSTYLLLQTIKDQPKDQIRTISITQHNIPANKHNKQARKNILKQLRNTHPKTHIHHTEIKIKSNTCATPGDGINQATIWIGTAIPYLHQDEDLLIGYIRTDDATHHTHHLQQAFTALQQLTGKTGKLHLPLEWTTKAEIINGLHQHNYYHLTWYCENPQPKHTLTGKTKPDHKATPCGNCTPCHTHQTALWQLQNGKTTIHRHQLHPQYKHQPDEQDLKETQPHEPDITDTTPDEENHRTHTTSN